MIMTKSSGKIINGSKWRNIYIINIGKERNTPTFHLGIQQSKWSLDIVLSTTTSKTSQHAWSPVHTWHSVLTEHFHPRSHNLHK